METVVNTDEVVLSNSHVEDDRHVRYTYTHADGNLSINESIENEVQEVNIPFSELIRVIEFIQSQRNLIPLIN